MSSIKELKKQKKIKIFIIIFAIINVIMSSFYISGKYKMCEADVIVAEMNAYETIANDNLEDMVIALETLSSCFETADGLTEEQSVQIMKALQKQHGFDYVVKTEADGNAENMDGKKDIYLGDRNYFQAGMQGELTTNFITQGKVDSSNSYILSAVPVTKNGEVVGIVHGSYSVDHYFDNISGNKVDIQDTLEMLVDAKGNIVASLSDKYKGMNLTECGMTYKDLSEFEGTVEQKGNNSFQLNISGVEYMASSVSTDFYEEDLFFVVARKNSKIVVEMNQLIQSLLPFLIVNGMLWAIWLMSIFYIVNRRNAEKETRRLNAMISNIPTGIIVYQVEDDDISIIECSAIALKMFGLKREKVIGAKNEALLTPIHEDDREAARQMIDDLSTANVIKNYDYRMYNASSKKYIWLRASAHSVVRRDRSVYIYISYTDITDEKKTEELRVELEATKTANEAKSRFLSRMSHEIRTPINAIIGVAELEKQDFENNSISAENIEKYAQDTIAASQYLLTLVNDVLDTAKIESDQMEIQQHPVYAKHYLSDIQTLIEPLVKEKNIHFKFQRKTQTHDIYIGDGVRVKQILVNLLNNAIKFTPPGGAVNLISESIAEQDNKATLQFTVSDNGVGMSKEFQKKMFTPFAQENSNTTSPFSGSGLGLSIAKSLAQKMGGDIICSSEKGKGTTFIVTIVVGIAEKEDIEQEQNEAVTEHKDVDFEGVRILVCEDHPLNQKITKALLERKKCLVDIAADGVIGVDMFEKSPVGYYDMVLMDIRMPNMDGLETTREIRALHREDAKSIPIVAMSANAYNEDIQQSLEAGMNAHLSKPVDINQLYQSIEKYTISGR